MSDPRAPAPLGVTAARLSHLAPRYRVERELGAGGMATVFLAHDVRHERRVALKVLRPELAAVIGAERFLHEIKTTANLSHPHILPLFDSGVEDGLLYYVMPFVEGESLRDRLMRERQLGVTEVVRIVTEVASALDYAHRHGVVHRDIKPENILLHDGSALVADFGIALAVSNAGSSRMTETGLSLGTPHYMSPEQAMGDRDIGARSDIYALGAVAYELLAGEPPFTGPNAQAIVARVLTEQPRALRAQRHTIPEHVQDAVERALEKLPADRFASAAEFAAAMHEPVSAPVTSPRSRAAASADVSRKLRHLRIAAIAGWSAAALLGVAAVAAWLRPDVPRPVSRFNVELENNEISVGVDAPAISPDGSRFVYGSAEQILMMRERDQTSASRIEGTNDAWSPFFSPDGRTLAFLTGFPGALRTVPLAGGPVTTVVADSTHGNGGAWSRDGWIYFIGYQSDRAALMRVRPDGSSREQIALSDPQRDELFFYSPIVLPGDRHVLLTVWHRRNPPAIVSIDVRTGERQVLMAGLRALYASSGHLLALRGDGTLQGVRFDPRTLRIDGRPITLVEGIRTGAQGGRSPLALSEEGTLLYEASAPVQQVVRVARDGSSRPVDPEWRGRFSYVVVSPAGDQLAIALEREGRTELWLRNLSDGTMSQLTAEGSYSYRASWSRDGRVLYFVSDRSGKGQVYGIPADGSGAAELVHEHPRGVDEISPSPFDEWSIVRVGSGSGRDVYGRRASDGEFVPLVATSAQEYSPILSPDGRWLAYGSDETGRSEVYVRPFPGVRGARTQVSLDGGTEPLWSRDGRELFYRSGNGDLIAAEVVAAPAFRPAARRRLFSALHYVSDSRHRAYSIGPDGDFYFAATRPGERSKLIVVQNWFEELKAKMP